MCTKFQAAILKKRLAFAVFNAQKDTVYAIYQDLGIFFYFRFMSDWGRSKTILGSFLRSWENVTEKYVSRHLISKF